MATQLSRRRFLKAVTAASTVSLEAQQSVTYIDYMGYPGVETFLEKAREVSLGKSPQPTAEEWQELAAKVERNSAAVSRLFEGMRDYNGADMALVALVHVRGDMLADKTFAFEKQFCGNPPEGITQEQFAAVRGFAFHRWKLGDPDLRKQAADVPKQFAGEVYIYLARRANKEDCQSAVEDALRNLMTTHGEDVKGYLASHKVRLGLTDRKINDEMHRPGIHLFAKPKITCPISATP